MLCLTYMFSPILYHSILNQIILYKLANNGLIQAYMHSRTCHLRISSNGYQIGN